MSGPLCEKCGANPVAQTSAGYDADYCNACREALLENPPAGHTYADYPDDDDPHCECGKWLEDRHYEYWDHIEDVDANGWDR